MFENFFIAYITQSNLIKIVLLHKLVEEIGTQHHRFGNMNLNACKAVKLGMSFDYIVKKGQTTPFPA